MALIQVLKGNASGAVQAIQDLKKEVAKTEKEFDKTTKSSKRLVAQAQRIKEATSPQERYNRQMRELAGHVNTGRISMNLAEQAALKYRKQLDRAGRSGKKAFGATALGNVRNLIGGFVSGTAAIAVLTTGFRQFREEQEKAQQAATQARGGVGALSQLAATAKDPKKEFAALLAESRAARAGGSADSQDEAANTLFSLVSAGLEKTDRDFAFKLKSRGTLENVGGAATAFAALTSAVGTEEIGSFEDFISKSLRASAVAPALVNQIPQAATRAGGSAAALGLTDEFLLSATAILGKTTGTAEQGGTQLASFLKQIEKSGDARFKGKTGIELVETLAGFGEEEKGFGGVLGDRAEAVQGFRTLSRNLDLLKSLTKEVDLADDAGLARVAVDLPISDPQQRAALAKARAEGALEVGLGEDAAGQNLLDAALAERTRTSIEDGGGAFSKMNIAVENMQIGIERFGGITKEYTDSVLREFAEEGKIKDKELLQDIADHLGDQTIVLNNISDQQTKPTPGGRQE